MMLAESLNILGLKHSALVKDVREAYWSMAMKAHPDHIGGSVEAFQTLVSAYQEVLSFIQNAPCDYCIEGYTYALDKNFHKLRMPCAHCMGTGRRG